ncbi:MerR family transcriptional regulator [Candidatus Contubernalis alkaliaceticus]|uniref:MerR family transcriptional regulator n=1 Tax=Candidatus Contubernalis alkaliaceticus TaxID=338645 RepID=UPI001F4C2146|nr:MerR family transcriptional regulator [Candidatus Contubernalis alkalaceticus]UNC92058.1 MerR family transcriptional regulator [Candidatus Contubernalis alkalaceticus]
MSYTVHEIAQLSGVTIKAMYHYHKIGLLNPQKTTEAGYRIYGEEQLNRLQQILFYRELKFSLEDIKSLLADEPNRLHCLQSQYSLLRGQQQRMDAILKTLETTIQYEQKGEQMDKSEMFRGLNKEEWEEVLAEQNEYLKKEYDYDPLESREVEPEKLNEQAVEVTKFLSFMAESLKTGRRADDREVKIAIKNHIEFINDKIYPTDSKSFVEEAEFFLTDDFHRNMYESHQTGLSYYIFTAAKMYAAKEEC